MSKANKYISVFVPVYNGEKYLSELIESVLNQNLPTGYSLEFLITDSGSEDTSVEIIKQYEDRVIFNQIQNVEYGHGKTRQAAAEKARGEYILFLSQDATPTDHRWLINMIEPFFISEKVGCVFGRQIPRPTSVPTIKREVSSVFGNFGSPGSITLQRNLSLVDNFKIGELNSFFSDVNSAVRTELLSKIPFRDVKYAEDQALAVDMQVSGYLKGYSVDGSVWHSNEYTIKEFRGRKFDEYRGLLSSTDLHLVASRKQLLTGWIRPTFADWKFIRHDGEYTKKTKVKYTVLSIGYNYSVCLGRYQAAKYGKDKIASSKLSLEELNKK